MTLGGALKNEVDGNDLIRIISDDGSRFMSAMVENSRSAERAWGHAFITFKLSARECHCIERFYRPMTEYCEGCKELYLKDMEII